MLRRFRRKVETPASPEPQIEAESPVPMAPEAPVAPVEVATPKEAPTEQVEQPASARRPVLRRRLLPFVINWPAMLLIVVLALLSISLLLINEGVIIVEAGDWSLFWPLILAIPAAIWFLVALMRRDAQGVVGAAALFGLSASLFLASPRTPLLPTVTGITFVAAGAGIMLRGLLLRRYPMA